MAQDEPDAATGILERMPVLERASAIAESALERVAELRHGRSGCSAQRWRWFYSWWW